MNSNYNSDVKKTQDFFKLMFWENLENKFNFEKNHLTKNTDYERCLEKELYLRTVLSLIQKSVPMKPDEFMHCPNCGSDKCLDSLNWENNYCPDCGQRIDWNGTDEQARIERNE